MLSIIFVGFLKQMAGTTAECLQAKTSVKKHVAKHLFQSLLYSLAGNLSLGWYYHLIVAYQRCVISARMLTDMQKDIATPKCFTGCVFTCIWATYFSPKLTFVLYLLLLCISKLSWLSILYKQLLIFKNLLYLNHCKINAWGFYTARKTKQDQTKPNYFLALFLRFLLCKYINNCNSFIKSNCFCRSIAVQVCCGFSNVISGC